MAILLQHRFPLLVLVVCVGHSAGQSNQTIITVTPEPNTETCELITSDIPTCINVPWNTTAFPNLRSHKTQAEAYAELEDFNPLIEVQCSNKIVHFLCGVYTPVCVYYGDGENGFVTIPPCKSLCEYVRNDCEPQLEAVGYTWPSHLNCDNFPATELGTCLDVPDDVEVPIVPGLDLRPTPTSAVPIVPTLELSTAAPLTTIADTAVTSDAAVTSDTLVTADTAVTSDVAVTPNAQITTDGTITTDDIITTEELGSCAALGFNGCCRSGPCLGGDGSCYCDQACYSSGTCCSDIQEINCFPAEALGSATIIGVALVGFVVGATFMVAVLVIVICCYLRNRKNTSANEKSANHSLAAGARMYETPVSILPGPNAIENPNAYAVPVSVRYVKQINAIQTNGSKTEAGSHPQAYGQNFISAHGSIEPHIYEIALNTNSHNQPRDGPQIYDNHMDTVLKHQQSQEAHEAGQLGNPPTYTALYPGTLAEPQAYAQVNHTPSPGFYNTSSEYTEPVQTVLDRGQSAGQQPAGREPFYFELENSGQRTQPTNRGTAEKEYKGIERKTADINESV